MAKIRAMIGSGGGSQTETLLWENQSPTSAFSSSTITLLESIASYDYLKIIYKSTASANDQFSLIVSVSDFRTTSGDNLNPKVRLDAKISASAAYSRAFYYSSDTVINLASVNASQIGGTGYTTNYCIPLKVYGVKNLGINVANIKVMDVTVVEGTNTIETGVEIKKILSLWQKSDGSSDNIHIEEWSYLRPSETYTAYKTTATTFAKKSIPNTDATAINSVSGTSFVYKAGSGDISRLGDTVQFFIYY